MSVQAAWFITLLSRQQLSKSRTIDEQPEYLAIQMGSCFPDPPQYYKFWRTTTVTDYVWEDWIRVRKVNQGFPLLEDYQIEG
jgi:hypothetical protein